MIWSLVSLVALLGVPVACLSWVLFARLFESGAVSPEQSNRELGRERELRRRSAEDPVAKRLTRYGGGFYGITALWTLIAAELVDLWGLLIDPSALGPMLQGGVGGLLSAFVAAQIENFVTAMTWFAFWSEGSVVVSLAVAFVGFRAGLEAARRVPWAEGRSLAARGSRAARTAWRERKPSGD